MTTETTTIDDRLDEFLRSLEEALGGPPDRSGEVVDEVRADLEAHVTRHRDAGASEAEAIDRALAEMGDPFELAHRMRREIPPFGGRTMTAIRYAAAGGVMVWSLFLLWHLRAWTYGFDPAVTALALLLPFPVVVLLWPRIVWRRNWLFGLIPAGLALGVALVFAVAGAQSSGETTLAIPDGGGGAGTTGDPVPAPVPAAADEAPGTPAIAVAAGLGAVALVLLAAMQRRSQRRVALLMLLLAAGAVEAAFQVEEWVFRQDRERVRGYLAAAAAGQSEPVEDGLRARGTPLRSGRVSVPGDGSAGFFLYWDRPLSSGFAIHYSSAEDEVWIQD